MHRDRQFDMRENPASDKRHGSRQAVSIKSISNDVLHGHVEAIVATGLSEQTSSDAHAHAPAHAASPQAATAEEAARASESPRAFEPLIASSEAAKLLGSIHVKTLQRYARRGELPGYRIAGHWFFRASDLDAWLESRVNSRTPTR